MRQQYRCLAAFRFRPVVENVSRGKMMRTKIKIGSSDQGNVGAVLLESDLTFIANVSRMLRSKYRPVRELSDLEFLSLFDIPAVDTLMNSGFNLRSTAALIEHFRERVESGWLQAPAYLCLLYTSPSPRD